MSPTAAFTLVCCASMTRNTKSSTFWYDRPALWFDQLECEFRLRQIETDKAKYDYLKCCLSKEDIITIFENFNVASWSTPYSEFTCNVIKECFDHEKQKLSIIAKIEFQDIQNEKPSELLERMRLVANGFVEEETMRTLWMQKLTKEVRKPLSNYKDTNLDKLAALADKVMDMTKNPTEPAVSQKDSHQIIAQIFDNISEISTNCSHLREQLTIGLKIIFIFIAIIFVFSLER